METNLFMLQSKLPSSDLAADLLVQTPLTKPVTMLTEPTPAKCQGIARGPWVKAATLARVTTDEGLLRQLSKKRTQGIRVEIVSNPATPQEVVDKIVADAVSDHHDAILEAATGALTVDNVMETLRRWHFLTGKRNWRYPPVVALFTSAMEEGNGTNFDQVGAGLELVELGFSTLYDVAVKFFGELDMAPDGPLMEAFQLASRDLSTGRPGELLKAHLNRENVTVNSTVIGLLNTYGGLNIGGLQHVRQWSIPFTLTTDAAVTLCERRENIKTVLGTFHYGTNSESASDLLKVLAPLLPEDMWPEALTMFPERADFAPFIAIAAKKPEIFDAVDDARLRRMFDYGWETLDDDAALVLLSAIPFEYQYRTVHDATRTWQGNPSLAEHRPELLARWAEANVDELLSGDLPHRLYEEVFKCISPVLKPADFDGYVRLALSYGKAEWLSSSDIVRHLKTTFTALAPDVFDADLHNRWNGNSFFEELACAPQVDWNLRRALLQHGECDLTVKALTAVDEATGERLVSAEQAAELFATPHRALRRTFERYFNPATAMSAGGEQVELWQVSRGWRTLLDDKTVALDVKQAVVNSVELPMRELVRDDIGLDLAYESFVVAFGDDASVWQLALSTVEQTEVPLEQFLDSVQVLAEMSS